MHFTDFLFPPSPEEIELRNLSEASLLLLPKALPTPFPFITSLFSYKNPVITELVWSIKYKKNNHAISLGANALYNELKKYNGKITLIPIPISKERRKERGYNQCELLVNEITELDTESRLNKNFDILIRKKHTSRQTLKNREERLKSAESIFGVNKIPLSGQIIIVDDVTTTGSTLEEARKVLLEAGYTDVKAITLAH